MVYELVYESDTKSIIKTNCIGRESNPGRPRGRRAFYHWTTDAHPNFRSQCLIWTGEFTLKSLVEVEPNFLTTCFPANAWHWTESHVYTGILAINLDLSINSAFNFNSNDNEILSFAQDEVAEWLRRWTANPLGSPRVSSNLIFVVYCFSLIHV